MAKVVLDIVANTGPLSDVADGMNDVASSSKKAEEAQKKAFKSGADSAANANKSIKDLTGNLTIAGVNVGALGRSFGETTKSISAVTKGFGFLKVAIASTGIGAIIIALVGLISYFTKTEKGAELLERATAGLGAAFDVLVGVLSNVGEFLIAVFRNPKQALIDLGNFLKENIINRFKAFSVILDGILSLDFKKINNGFIQASTGIENAIDKAQKFGASLDDMAKKAFAAAKAAAELKRKFQDLEDSERANAIIISKNQTEIDKLLVKSKNRSLAEKERIALLDQAAKLEQSNLALELEGSNKRVAIIQGENRLKKEAGTLRDEDEDKLKDAIIARDNLERGSLVLQEKIINRRDALIEEITAKQQKAIDDKKKADEDAAKAEQDRIDKIKKAFDDETALNDLASQREQARLKTQFANNLISETDYNNATNDAKAKALQIQLDTIKSFNKDGLDLSKEQAAKEIEITNAGADIIIKRNDKIKALEKAKSDFLKTIGLSDLDDKKKHLQDELNDLIVNLDEEKALRIAAAAETGASVADIEKQYQKDKFEITKDFKEQEKALDKANQEEVNKARQQNLDQLLAQTHSTFDDLNEIFSDNFEAQKAFAIANTIISTYESAQKSYNSLSGIPYVGPILGAIAAGIAVAAGLARVNKIAEQQPKKFDKGGYTGDGGKYDEAGVVHKGEFVTTKEKTKKHRNLLEAIHNNDYSNLKLIDLAPLLNGTGVSLNSDVAENVNILHSQHSELKSKKEYALEKRMEAMQKDMNKFFSFYKAKPTERTLPDGSKEYKSGNVTRIIKKK